MNRAVKIIISPVEVKDQTFKLDRVDTIVAVRALHPVVKEQHQPETKTVNQAPLMVLIGKPDLSLRMVRILTRAGQPSKSVKVVHLAGPLNKRVPFPRTVEEIAALMIPLTTSLAPMTQKIKERTKVTGMANRTTGPMIMGIIEVRMIPTQNRVTRKFS